MSDVQVQGNVYLKTGANTSDQKAIKAAMAQGKSAEQIVREIRVNEKTVRSFMEFFENGGTIAAGIATAATVPDPNEVKKKAEAEVAEAKKAAEEAKKEAKEATEAAEKARKETEEAVKALEEAKKITATKEAVKGK